MADVFVSKFNNALSDLTASTFIGGTEEDIGYALATDQAKLYLCHRSYCLG